jgi:mannose/fructose/N-acetylgalactosamine-specific phosphotransferase system component IIC
MRDVWTALANATPVAMLGAVCGLDMVSFPQIMIARPIVSATAAGTFVGRPGAGLLMGAVLELIALETLPFGASRYAEWGSAGVVGGALYAAQPAGAPGAFPLSILAALTAALFSSWSMVVLRKQNGCYARSRREAINAGSAAAVTGVQLWGLINDLIRGGIVTLVSLLVFTPLAHQLVPLWKTDAVRSRAFVIALAAMVAAGAVWKLFHTTVRGGWLFLVGLAIGGGVLYASQ